MAKYVQNAAGDFAEVIAANVSTGAATADQLISTNASGKLDSSFFPSGYGPDTLNFLASEAITAGAFVNIYSNSGTPSVRNADANAIAKRAWGYAPSAIANGTSGAVYFDDVNSAASGQTVGEVYLSITTPGATQTTAPVGAGKIVQSLGVASSATTIHVSIAKPLILA